jgi:tetratricopeptide (TPR) repeat protein
LGRDDWFRNTSWNPETEAAFMARLRRARDKSQYLRIQASYLTGTAPEAALRLLAHYFQLGEHFDQAQAHVERARAYITLGNLDAALNSYEAALERERAHPRLQTRAHLDFPLLIVMRRLSELYSRAMEILDATQSRLMFPIDRYLAHGVRALILDEWGKRDEARNYAALALAAASETESGLRYHQDVGLVPAINDDLACRLKAIAQTRH